MALVPAFIRNGTYSIYNVQFHPNDADLINPGGVNGYVGGFPNNHNTRRMVWALTNVYDGMFTLTNQEVRTYASVNATGNGLVGSADTPAVQWAAYPSGTDGQYYIASFGVFPVVWTLPNGNSETPITLTQAVQDPVAQNQLWQFVPFE